MDTNSITTVTFKSDLTPTIENYVNRFRFYARNTVENIILLAETAYEAELRLKPDDFNSFCDEVKMDPKGSTFRKMRQIGKMKDRFLPHLNILPNNWTTVYELSRLSNAEFDGLIEKDVVHADVTADDIKKGLKPVSETMKDENVIEVVRFNLTLKAKTYEEAFQIEQDLKGLANKYKSKIGISNEALLDRWKFFDSKHQIAA